MSSGLTICGNSCRSNGLRQFLTEQNRLFGQLKKALTECALKANWITTLPLMRAAATAATAMAASNEP